MPLRALVLVLAVAWLAGGPARAARAQASAPAQPFTGELKLVLWDSVFQGDTPANGTANLVLDLAAVQGRWDRVWGIHLGYSKGISEGVVRQATTTADGMSLELLVRVEGDAWIKRDVPARYEVDLKPDGAGRFTGTYRGTFAGAALSGRATAELKPVRAPLPAGFEPVRRGEHPRLLFRKGDLPALREKLKTPLGQAYLERARAAAEVKRWPGDPISAGMVYALTGDKQYADLAMDVVKRYLADAESFTSDKGAGSGGWGHLLVAAILAYDLCYDAWPEDFKRELDDRLLGEPILPGGEDPATAPATRPALVARRSGLLANLITHLLVTSHANPHPCSNYYGPGHGAPGIASLFYYGDAGVEPPSPASPDLAAVPVEAPPDYQPPAGVPVSTLTLGQSPREWLWAGPLPGAAAAEELAANIGYRVAPGAALSSMQVNDGQITETSLPFKPVPADAVAPAGLSVDKLGADGAVTHVFFTALKVERETLVTPVPGLQSVCMWLDRLPLLPGKSYRLAPGVHPLLVVATLRKPAGVVLAPRLGDLDSPDVGDRKLAGALERALWQADHDAWRRDGTDSVKQRTFERGRVRNYHHYRLGIGDGGFQAETGSYAAISSWYPLVYAMVYRNLFGQVPSPYEDVGVLVVRRMMQVVFLDGGKTFYQKLNSVAGFDQRFVAAAFPIIPARYQPAVLWAWNKVAGVTDEASTANIVKQRDLGGLQAALAFINYPLGMTPEPPAKALPLDWAAPTFGFYCFRSGWQGADEFVGQVFAKASLIGGWNHPNAGTFRLLGLGHEWVAGSTERVGFREQEPCVLLLDDDISQGACGQVTYLKTEKDGSGVVTLDLSDVYSAAGSKIYDGNLLRMPDRRKDSGISGLRAFAFDYSGKSGAPALVAIVDQIKGGKTRTWQWVLPPGTASKVKTDDHGFTLDYGDASLRLTFVTPPGAKPEAVSEKLVIGKIGDSHRSFEGQVDRVKVTGDGDFFVVATVQRGPAPEVKVEGTGLAAKVTVGGQTVRFDGQKVVLGP